MSEKPTYTDSELSAVIGELTGLAEEILCLSVSNAAIGARRSDRYWQVSSKFKVKGMCHAAEFLLNRAAVLSLKDASLTIPECCQELHK